MRTYWDLSEKERAELSADGVQKWIEAELMVKGVLALPELEPEYEPVVKLPMTRCFRIVRGYTRSGGLAFASEDSALAFLALTPLAIESSWDTGSENEYLEAFEGKVEVAELPTKDDVVKMRVALKAQQAAKTANSQRREARSQQEKKIDDVLRGLWEDWHACREKAARVAEVNRTREKYVLLAAGDASIAASFLAQVFNTERLDEAAQW
jgi:hypothetical protein